MENISKIETLLDSFILILEPQAGSEQTQEIISSNDAYSVVRYSSIRFEQNLHENSLLEYRNEIDEYRVRYNVAELNRILNRQYEKCGKIKELWGKIETHSANGKTLFFSWINPPSEYKIMVVETNMYLLATSSEDEIYSMEEIITFTNRIIATISNYLPELKKQEKSDNPQQIPIPDNILLELQKHGFIENAAARPLKWSKSKSLLAYFVDVANDKLNLKHGEKRMIKPFEKMFNVAGISSAINEYKNKTGQKPVGYEVIDKILK